MLDDPLTLRIPETTKETLSPRLQDYVFQPTFHKVSLLRRERHVLRNKINHEDILDDWNSSCRSKILFYRLELSVQIVVFEKKVIIS